MSDTTAMVPVNLDQLPSTQIGTDDQFAELAKGGDYINRLKLYTKSKDSIKGLIPDGHYGIPESDEKETAIRQLHSEGKPIAEIARVVGLSRPTVYKAIG